MVAWSGEQGIEGAREDVAVPGKPGYLMMLEGQRETAGVWTGVRKGVFTGTAATESVERIEDLRLKEELEEASVEEFRSSSEGRDDRCSGVPWLLGCRWSSALLLLDPGLGLSSGRLSSGASSTRNSVNSCCKNKLDMAPCPVLVLSSIDERGRSCTCLLEDRPASGGSHTNELGSLLPQPVHSTRVGFLQVGRRGMGTHTQWRRTPSLSPTVTFEH